ncbi:hypothetical protein BpHYR1_045021, partial [Brachionus plicatilis]
FGWIDFENYFWYLVLYNLEFCFNFLSSEYLVSLRNHSATIGPFKLRIGFSKSRTPLHNVYKSHKSSQDFYLKK